MNRIDQRKTMSMQILAVCVMVCGIATGQPRQAIQQSASGAQMPNTATGPSGQLRWYSAQGGLFSSVADACQAGFTTFQAMFDKINHLPNVKGPVVTVSMLAPTSATYAGAPSFNCNYLIKSPQGAQQRSIGLVGVCASPGNVTPAPKSLRCGSINAMQAPASPQTTQATVPGVKSASPAESAAAILNYLQQAQNSFQGATLSNGSTSDQPSAVPAGNMTGAVRSSAQTSSGADAGSSVPSPGVGFFKGRDVVLTAYGCFRTGAVVLCDFDVTKQTSAPFKASVLWSSLGFKDNSGRVLKRHDAFFLAADGTHQPLATLSTNPVRLIMEFTDVDVQLSEISLVNGQEQISGVPIDMADPGQPEGTVPSRTASLPTATQPKVAVADPPQTALQPSSAPTAKTNALDGANQAVDKVNQNINKVIDAKQKGESIWDAVKTLPRK